MPSFKLYDLISQCFRLFPVTIDEGHKAGNLQRKVIYLLQLWKLRRPRTGSWHLVQAFLLQCNMMERPHNETQPEPVGTWFCNDATA